MTRITRSLGEHRAAIQAALAELAERPDQLESHKKLRRAGLRFKAAGGRSLGIMSKWKLQSPDPLQRLIIAARNWAYEPGSSDQLSYAAKALKTWGESAKVNVSQVMEWHQRIWMKMPANDRKRD